MTQLTVLQPYVDARGNEIVYTGEPTQARIAITFKGANNRLVVAPDAKLVDLVVQFHGDGSAVEIKGTKVPRTGLRFAMRLGHASGVRIGENVGSQGRTMITAVEGADVTIGNDCMIATGVEIRTDDAHPIYDVRTGERLNLAQSVAIGNHVWIAKFAAVMGGVRIGDGAVIGYRSIVTKDVPNNAVAAGAPARVIRRDAAWERTRLLVRHPGEPGPGPNERHDEYWNLSHDEPAPWPAPVKRPEPRDPAELAQLAQQLPAPEVAQRAPAAPAQRPRLMARVRRRVRRFLRL